MVYVRPQRSSFNFPEIWEDEYSIGLIVLSIGFFYTVLFLCHYSHGSDF